MTIASVELFVTLVLLQMAPIVRCACFVVTPGIEEVLRKILVSIRAYCRWEARRLLDGASVLRGRL